MEKLILALSIYFFGLLVISKAQEYIDDQYDSLDEKSFDGECIILIQN